MASITLSVPDEIGGRVLTGFCMGNQYQEQVVLDGTSELVPNPEDMFSFMKRKLAEYVMESVILYESTLAQAIAKETAETNARNDIVIT